VFLVAQEENDSETYRVINVESTYDELLSEYNELHSEFIKLAKELANFKKKNQSLEVKVSVIHEVISKCAKCEKLEKKNRELTKTLKKFGQGSEMLNVILGN